MKYVTGMIGDRVYTLTVDGATVQGEGNIMAAFADLPAHNEGTVLAQCRKLFGDTMQVRDDAPGVIPGPFLADSPAMDGAAAVAPAGGVLHEADVVIPPAAPGSASMTETAENVPEAGTMARPTTAGRR